MPRPCSKLRGIRLADRINFFLERTLVRGAQYRLLLIAALVGLISLAGGALVLVTSAHVPARETKVGVEPLGGRPSPRAFERGSGER